MGLAFSVPLPQNISQHEQASQAQQGQAIGLQGHTHQKIEFPRTA
jgi:hypothetical protein